MKTKRHIKYCAFYGCLSKTNTSSDMLKYKHKEISYFTLPADEERRNKWLEIINRSDLIRPGVNPKNYVICSKHFHKSSMNFIPKLKPDASPVGIELELKVYDKTTQTKALPNILSTKTDTIFKSLPDSEQTYEKKTNSENSQTSYSLSANTLNSEELNNVINPTKDILEKKVRIKRSDFKCNECNGDIIGFRYACVQCADYDVCAACEARGKHKHHYALRVPADKSFHAVLAILDRIRDIVNKEKQEIAICKTESVKSEIDTESDPLEDASTDQIKVESTQRNDQDSSIGNAATIKEDVRLGKPNQHQSRIKRRASSPNTRTRTPPVTLADTQTRMSLDCITKVTSKRLQTKKPQSKPNKVSNFTKRINVTTTRSEPMITVPNVTAPITYNQASGSGIPVFVFNIPNVEQNDQALTSNTNSNQTKLRSIEPTQLSEDLYLQTELPH